MAEKICCPKCSHPLDPQDDNRWCKSCGAPVAMKILDALQAQKEEAWRQAEARKREEARRQDEAQKREDAELRLMAEKIICTTAPRLEGYRITKTLDVITAECFCGVNIFFDILASITDVIGGRSKALEKVLGDARKTCLFELRKEALNWGRCCNCNRPRL